MKVPVEISARHIHLSEDDFVTLFGEKKLSKRNDLSQKGEFAANESVEVVGPDGRLKKVRIIGPFREYSQLEVSQTDSRFLGIDAPIAVSGSRKGAHIKILGPYGSFIKGIAMVAQRHLHLSARSAQKHGLKNNSKISVLIDSSRKTVFGDIVVRVSDAFVDVLHLDTDEANASNAYNGMMVAIIKE